MPYDVFPLGEDRFPDLPRGVSECPRFGFRPQELCAERIHLP